MNRMLNWDNSAAEDWRKRWINGIINGMKKSYYVCWLLLKDRILGLIKTCLNSIILNQRMKVIKANIYWVNKLIFKFFLFIGINFVIKYVLFGYDKVKDEKLENDSNMIQYIKDLEDVNELSLIFFLNLKPI